MLNRKVIILLLLTVSFFLIAVNVQAGFLFIITSILISLIVVSYLVPIISVRNVEVKRVVPPEAFEFEEVPVELIVKTKSRWPRLLLQVSDTLFLEKEHLIPLLTRAKVEKLSFTARPLRRGHYSESQIIVRCSAPFGIYCRERRLTIEADLLVYPAFYDLQSVPVLEAQSYPYEKLHERRAKGSSYDYLGTREYRSGDSLRIVHWRSSARQGELIVKEFEEESSSSVTMLLDLADGALDNENGQSIVDSGVRIVASLARYVSEAGHPFHLFGHSKSDETFLRQPTFWQALDWLARYQPEDGRTPSMLLDEIAPIVRPRSTVVIISQSTSPKWIDLVSFVKAMKLRAILVLVDKGSFAGRESSLKTDELVDVMLEGRVNVYLYRKGDSVAGCFREPLNFINE